VVSGTTKLAFRVGYREPILAGEKTTTLRLGTRLRPGDRVEAQSSRRPFATLEVADVTDVAAGELTEEMARDNGFVSVAELLRELERLYPGRNRFAWIRFRVIES
jgi:hypothetical protein